MSDHPSAIGQVLLRARWRARPALGYRAAGERSPSDVWRAVLCKAPHACCLMTRLSRALSVQMCQDYWDLEFLLDNLDRDAAKSWQIHDVCLRAQPWPDPDCDR